MRANSKTIFRMVSISAFGLRSRALNQIQILATGVAFFCCYASAFAQPENIKPLTGGLPSVVGDDGSVWTHNILIRPKAATQALSSRFFPSQDKLHPGNAAPIFLRNNWEAFSAMRDLREFDQKDFGFVPLDELNLAEIGDGPPLRLNDLRRAAFRTQAGWEYPLNEEPRASILLPDVGESRIYCRVLLAIARADIKRGNLEAAEDKICIAMGLAKHIGETPLVICRIVQLTQMSMTLQSIEELVQHPMATNYYWDLTSLPRPCVDVRSAIQFESSVVTQSFPELLHLNISRTDEEWKAIAARILDLSSSVNGELPRLGSPEGDQAFKEWVRIARERLPKIDPNVTLRVNAMSEAEAFVRYWWERNEKNSASQMALALLEPSQAIPRLIESSKRTAKEFKDEFPGQLSSYSCLSFVTQVALLDQKIAMLRTIESIRDWSAHNEGRLPDSLEALNLPAPLDCINNRPFLYAISPDKRLARLHGAIVEYPDNFGNGNQGKTTRRGNRYQLTIE